MTTTKEHFKFTMDVVLYPLVVVLAMWIVLWVELRFGMNFTQYGILPRKLSGLKGIILSPFIHSGFTHLWHNSIPILVLTTALFYFYRHIRWSVLLGTIVLSGIGTWLLGRPAYHIGMSGVIYGLVAFLFFKGIMTRHYRLIALSLLVVFLYGSLIWGVFPQDNETSWEGHLAGFVVGMLLSLRFRESVPTTPTYAWEQPNYSEEDDPFMRHFDEHGNFIEKQPEDNEDFEIVYTYLDEEE